MSYTEDSLAEQLVIVLFAAIGWQTLSTMDESFDAGGNARARNQGRGGVCGAPTRHAVHIQPHAAAGGHQQRHR